ncbi:MAG: hypothetical protein WAT71_12515 [Ignavibacteria bacterium]
MKANISLALATKIDMILSENYGSDQRKFLSFVPPAKQMSFDFDELVLTTNGEEGIDVQVIDSNKYNFSYLSNLIPEDNVMFQDKNGLLLWDQFKKIIANSIPANMILSNEDQAKLKEKRTFLENNSANYYNYKNLYDNATFKFLDAKKSLDCSTGEDKEKLQYDWNDYLKKILEERIFSALNDLIIFGKKNEIEECLQSISNILSRKGIGNLKAEISSKLDSFIATENDSEIEYYTTLYSPNNIFQKKTEWSKITLYNSEIISLCENAKSELKNSYSGNDSGDNIEYLSFEYAVVSIVRPWFFEEFLNSNSFKLNELVEPVINDGKTPASGMIPCYINKFICIKKIEYKQKKDTTVSEELTLPIISVLPLKKFKISTIKPLDRSQLVRSGIWAKTKKSKPGTLSSPDKTDSKVHIHDRTEVKVNDQRDVSRVRDHRTITKTAANNRKLFLWNRKHIATGISSKIEAPAIVNPINDKPAENLVVEELDGVRIVAFECKRLNLSPNPNMDLDWN